MHQGNGQLVKLIYKDSFKTTLLSKKTRNLSPCLPDTIQEVRVVICHGVKIIAYGVIQDSMTVLEVVEHTQNSAVVVVGGKRSQADVLQLYSLIIIKSSYVFNSILKI